MSVKAIEWAFETHVGNADEKQTLLALAYHHNGKTGLCCPSQDTLAKETERSVDRIQHHIKSLEKKGLIKRQRQYVKGFRTTDKYTLAIDGNFKPEPAKLTPHLHGISSEDLTPHLRGVSTPDLTPQLLGISSDEPYTAKRPHLTQDSCGVIEDEQEEQEYKNAADRNAEVRITDSLTLLHTEDADIVTKGLAAHRQSILEDFLHLCAYLNPFADQDEDSPVNEHTSAAYLRRYVGMGYLERQGDDYITTPAGICALESFDGASATSDQMFKMAA
jgi:Helix-turn-helix domain